LDNLSGLVREVFDTYSSPLIQSSFEKRNLFRLLRALRSKGLLVGTVTPDPVDIFVRDGLVREPPRHE
jgi:hypothetical protein